jgi:hypothetical protein
MARDSQQAPQATDHNVDRFPNLKDALQRVIDSKDVENIPVDHVDIKLRANGELTFSYWEPRTEDPLAGSIPPPAHQ